MKILSRISYRHLLSHYTFSFISFSTFLSIAGLSIGVASLIIVSTITNGFNYEVNKKLSNIDGHVRIDNYLNGKMDLNEFSYLSSYLDTSTLLTSYTPYIEKHAFIKQGDKSEGILIYGVKPSSLNKIFNIDDFANNKVGFNDHNSIIIGEKLALMFNVGIGDDLILFDMGGEGLFAQKFKVSNIFKTEFPEYDKILAFMDIEKAQIFFNMDNFLSGLIFNLHDPLHCEAIIKKIEKDIGHFPYSLTTWKDRHYSLLEWLKVYDVPIKIIIIFIMLIGLFNIAASLWMIVVEKTSDYALLRSLGLPSSKIQNIILYQGLAVGVLGSFFGLIIALLLLFIQNTFNVISIPSDIYFMSSLPIKFELSHFLLYPFFAIIISCLCSYAPSLSVLRFNISKIMRYE